MSLFKPPYLLRLAQALFFLNAVIWAVIGIVSLARLGGSSGQSTTALILSVLMIGNAAAMLWSGWAIGRQKMLFVYLAMIVLIVNLSLTVTDQFGLWDMITMLIDLVLLVLLVLLRNRNKEGKNTPRSGSR